MKKYVWGFVIGTITGVSLCLIAIQLLSPEMSVEGTLRYSPPPNPINSGEPPEGFYVVRKVDDRIYLKRGDAAAVGKHVFARGRITAVECELLDGVAYPAIANGEISVHE